MKELDEEEQERRGRGRWRRQGGAKEEVSLPPSFVVSSEGDTHVCFLRVAAVESRWKTMKLSGTSFSSL